MSSKLKVLQVIPRLGYGGAEIGCYDLAHYLKEQKSSSFIATSGGELLKYIDKKKVKLFRLPVQSKNPFLILINIFILTFIVLFYKINIVFSIFVLVDVSWQLTLIGLIPVPLILWGSWFYQNLISKT